MSVVDLGRSNQYDVSYDYVVSFSKNKLLWNYNCLSILIARWEILSTEKYFLKAYILQ